MYTFFECKSDELVFIWASPECPAVLCVLIVESNINTDTKKTERTSQTELLPFYDSLLPACKKPGSVKMATVAVGKEAGAGLNDDESGNELILQNEDSISDSSHIADLSTNYEEGKQHYIAKVREGILWSLSTISLLSSCVYVVVNDFCAGLGVSFSFALEFIIVLLYNFVKSVTNDIYYHFLMCSLKEPRLYEEMFVFFYRSSFSFIFL